MRDRPVVFVASSSEQLSVAQRIQDGLTSEHWRVVVWNSQFAFSEAYIESLEDALDAADFAVVVMTGDDQGNVRQSAVVLPRDNVIFELGLFIGRLGRDRCAFFHDASKDTRIASDLKGVKGADFYPDAQADGTSLPRLADRVRDVKQQIKHVLDEAGPRYRPDRATRTLQQRRWHFLKHIEGAWWERMRRDDDNESALSLVTITAEAASSAAHLEGKAFDLAGHWLGTWHADASLDFETMPTLRYSWGGWHEGHKAAAMAGQGDIVFDKPIDSPAGAGPFYGSYFDTRLAEIRDGMAPTHEKRSSLVRLSTDDLARMQDPLSATARERVLRVLDQLAWG